MKSNVLHMPTQLTVIVPGPGRGRSPEEFYNNSGKYKVLWLLHGGGGDQRDWVNNTGIVRYVENRGVIVVCPNALDSDFAPQPQFAGGYDFPKLFFEELMPFIYNFFPASAEPKDNYISGLSMGGSGTMLLSMMHPEKFGGIAPLSCSLRISPYLEEYRNYTGEQLRALAMEDRTRFPSEWAAPGEGISIKELNAICKYPTVDAYLKSCEYTGGRYAEIYGKLPKMYYTCGTDDPCYPKALEFESLTKVLGVTNATFEYVPGYRHEWDFWDLAIKKVLDFFEI
ncbi:MAG: alpha/beta hydrolase [Oscillospiraceae bacterium]